MSTEAFEIPQNFCTVDQLLTKPATGLDQQRPD